MLGRLKETFAKLSHGKPGERFIRYHRCRQHAEQEHPWKRALYIMLGIILVLAGLVLGLTPGAPGIVLAAPGLGLLVARLRIVAHWLDRTELFLYRCIQKVRGGGGS